MPSAPNNSYTQVTYFGVALPNSRQLPSVRAQTQIIVQILQIIEHIQEKN